MVQQLKAKKASMLKKVLGLNLYLSTKFYLALSTNSLEFFFLTELLKIKTVSICQPRISKDTLLD